MYSCCLYVQRFRPSDNFGVILHILDVFIIYDCYEFFKFVLNFRKQLMTSWHAACRQSPTMGRSGVKCPKPSPTGDSRQEKFCVWHPPPWLCPPSCFPSHTVDAPQDSVENSAARFVRHGCTYLVTSLATQLMFLETQGGCSFWVMLSLFLTSYCLATQWMPVRIQGCKRTVHGFIHLFHVILVTSPPTQFMPLPLGIQGRTRSASGFIHLVPVSYTHLRAHET